MTNALSLSTRVAKSEIRRLGLRLMISAAVATSQVQVLFHATPATTKQGSIKMRPLEFMKTLAQIRQAECIREEAPGSNHLLWV